MILPVAASKVSRITSIPSEGSVVVAPISSLVSALLVLKPTFDFFRGAASASPSPLAHD